MNLIKRTLNKVLPRNLLYALISMRYETTRFLHSRRYLGGDYYCPICKNRVTAFLIEDQTAWCPICEGGERHRVDWEYMSGRTNLVDGVPKRLLHIAPEMVFVSAFSEIPNLSYVSGDLENPRAQQRMDITKIDYRDDTFDVIYCSHVLEHIPDDQLALRELYRVCKPGGWGLLQVPITTDRTFEDPSVVTPAERLAVFGQDDHVRRCGLDYADRMRTAGFSVKVVKASEILSPEQFVEMGITKRDRYVFHCLKPS